MKLKHLGALALFFCAVFSSAQVQLGKGVQIGGASGGGSPVGPLTAIQTKGSSGFAGSSGALSDTVGNTFVKSYAGTLDSYINQTDTATMSGDGVFNSLQTQGAYVTVNQGYNPSNNENGIGNTTGFYRTPFCCGGTAQTNPGFAADTISADVRYQDVGRFYYNLSSRAFGNTFNLWLHNYEPQVTSTGVEGVDTQEDDVRIGSGKNQEDGVHGMGLWDTHNHYLLNQIHLARGISSAFALNTLKGEGDYQGFQCQFDAHGSDPDGSGEGKTCYRDEAAQSGSVWSFPAAATYMTGATTVGGSGFNGTPPYYFDADYLLDVTQAGTPFYVTASTGFSGTNPGTLTTTSTYTPDNRGVQTADMANGAVPQQYGGATTPVTVTVSGLSAAPVTTLRMCVADSTNDENVQVTNVASYSGGTATLTANFRYWHPAGTVYAQGPQACTFINFMVNSGGNFKNAVRIVDASAAHTLEYSAHLFGGWAKQPDGLWNTQGFASGTTFVRDASGIVTVVVSGDGLSGAGFGGQEVTIKAASGLPSTFYGSWDMTEVDGTSDATVTFPTGVTGAAGSFTSTGPAYLSHLMIENPAAQLIPGAEIVYAGDPTLHVLNGNMALEANGITIAAGDTLQSQGGPEPVFNVHHSLIQMVTPSQGGTGLTEEFIVGRPTANYTDHTISDISEPNYFLTDGGTHPGITHEILTSAHYAKHWDIQAPIPSQGGGVLTVHACTKLTATQCSNAHYFGWNLNQILSPIGGYQDSYTTWRSDLLQKLTATSSGSAVNFDRWTIANHLGAPGAGWSIENIDTVNNAHNEIGSNSASGAYLYDYLTNAEVTVQPGVVTETAGSGSTVVLTPTTFQYGGSDVCTAAAPCTTSAVTNITISVEAGTFPAGCASGAGTAVMTNLLTSSTLYYSPSSDQSTVTGWGTQDLFIYMWPTANQLNYHICNRTASSITTTVAASFNVGAQK